MSSNFSISIDLVWILCASILYIGIRTLVPFLTLFTQSLANYLNTSASSILIVFILRSLLFSWFADATCICSMCLFLLCSIAQSI